MKFSRGGACKIFLVSIKMTCDLMRNKISFFTGLRQRKKILVLVKTHIELWGSNGNNPCCNFFSNLHFVLKTEYVMNKFWCFVNGKYCNSICKHLHSNLIFFQLLINFVYISQQNRSDNWIKEKACRPSAWIFFFF